MAVQFTVDPTILKGFLFYSTIVLAKTMIMSFLTAKNRFRKGAFANTEDIKGKEGAKVILNDPDVERVRRCHLNDLENVYLFVLLGLLYSLTGPSATIALWHFRIFAVSRVAHTIVYLGEVPQPSRALTWAAGIIVCASMIVQIIVTTF